MITCSEIEGWTGEKGGSLETRLHLVLAPSQREAAKYMKLFNPAMKFRVITSFCGPEKLEGFIIGQGVVLHRLDRFLPLAPTAMREAYYRLTFVKD